VPQEICNSWEPNRAGKYQRVEGGKCQYKGVLSAGLLGIAIGYKDVSSQWNARLTELGVGNGTPIMGYLGKKWVLEVVESNNLAREFCWVTQLLAELAG
jgi:hypothetical protein